MEIGTLKELNVKPGDVVVLIEDPSQEHMTCKASPPREWKLFEDHWDFGNALFRDGQFRVISRASDTPKKWKDMTDEEMGLLLLAQHRGRDIEYYSTIYKTWKLQRKGRSGFFPNEYYRVRPEPVRETVMLYGYNSSVFTQHLRIFSTHAITFDLIDGEPVTNSIRMEKL